MSRFSTLARFSPMEFPDFVPHPLLRNGHLQTLAGAYWPQRRIPYQAKQHIVQLADGDRLVLHDDRPPAWQIGDPTVLLVHGLGGSHASPYMVRIAAKMAACGFRVWRMDMRGCGAGFQLAQFPGHAGRSDDIRAAVDSISCQCIDSPLAIVGFSLGGNLVLKYAAESGANIPLHIRTATAIAPPIDLNTCSQNISRRGNWIYNRAFLLSLKKQIELKRRFIPAINSLQLAPAPKSLREFDDRVTAVLSGFSGADEYYRLASASPLLKYITVPTLIVSAYDDPLIPSEIFDSTSLSQTTQICRTGHGGHVGFIGVRNKTSERNWLDQQIIKWITNQN